LLLLAGVNVLIFELIIACGAAHWERGVPVPRPDKIAAALSLTLWGLDRLFGRRVGFTMTPG
jgi:hypothetical protein